MAIISFAIGTAEFLPMGILLNISNDLQITVGQAGQIITWYAFGVAIGAPIVTIFFMRFNKKHAIAACVIIFIIGNIFSAIATTYSVLMISRIFASLAHGACFGIGVLFVSEFAPEDKKNSAIAVMFSGLTIANVIGVPIGTFIGQSFGWRYSFAFATTFGAIGLLALIFFAPRSNSNTNISLSHEIKTLFKKPVIISIFTTIFGFAGVFTVFTYIAPILVQISKVEEKHIGIILILFGIGSTIGNIAGGKLADWNLRKSTVLTISVLLISQFSFNIAMNYKISAISMVLILGIVSFLPCMSFLSGLLSRAKDAPNLASSMNVGAFNIANGIGAMIGGKALDFGLPYSSIPLLAGSITLIGLLLGLYNISLEKKSLEIERKI